jgi:LysM repeat protein
MVPRHHGTGAFWRVEGALALALGLALTLLGGCGSSGGGTQATAAAQTTARTRDSIDSITASASVDAPIASSTANLADRPDVYTVVPGDTLSAIATRFETTVQDIQALNDVADPNTIFVGQELRIPPRTTTADSVTSSGT